MIINQLLGTHTYPDSLKLSKIKPLHKEAKQII